MNSPFSYPPSPISKNFVTPFPQHPATLPPKIVTGPTGAGKWMFAAALLQAQMGIEQQNSED